MPVPGDVVVGINGVSCKGMTAQQVASQLMLMMMMIPRSLLKTNMLMIVISAMQLLMTSMTSLRRELHNAYVTDVRRQVIEELKKVTDVIAVLDLVRAPPATL